MINSNAYVVDLSLDFDISCTLMSRIWFHIEILLIHRLIHSWMSLPTTFLLRAPITCTSS